MLVSIKRQPRADCRSQLDVAQANAFGFPDPAVAAAKQSQHTCDDAGARDGLDSGRPSARRIQQRRGKNAAEKCAIRDHVWQQKRSRIDVGTGNHQCPEQGRSNGYRPRQRQSGNQADNTGATDQYRQVRAKIDLQPSMPAV